METFNFRFDLLPSSRGAAFLWRRDVREEVLEALAFVTLDSGLNMADAFLENALAENPYLDEVLSLVNGDMVSLYGFDGLLNLAKLARSRRELIYKYAFAIPNEPALRKIAERAPIVEIGAGSGYWAHLLSKMGVDVVAYDNWRNPNRTQWFDVQLSDESAVKNHSDRALFLCWPPFKNEMALNTIRQYEGKTVIYVGENEGGCTATDSFFDFLYKQFEQEDSVEIPVWPTMHDRMTIFTRWSGG